MRKILIYLFVMMPFAVFSQSVLSLEECLRLAKGDNKRMEASEQQVQSSLFEVRSARASFLPSFSVSGNALYSNAGGAFSSGVGHLPVFDASGVATGQTALFPGLDLSYDVGWIYGAGVSVEQPLYMGGKIRAGYRMAKAGHELARQNRRLTEAEVVLETSQAYAAVVRAKELMLVAGSYRDLLTELLRTVESARKHGLKSQNDVLKVKVKLDGSELDLRRAENGWRLARMNLCHCIGRPLTDEIDVDGSLPEVGEVSAAGGVINDRPEYMMLERQEALAKEKIAVAKGDHLPQVGLVGRYGYTNGVELNGRKLLDDCSFFVGLQVSVPVFDFGRRVNKIRSAKAQYAQVVAECEDTFGKLELEMSRALNELDEASLECRLADSSVASAEENLRTSRLQYEKGVETLSDHLEAQALWQQARETQVEARVNRYLKWLEYRKTVGQL